MQQVTKDTWKLQESWDMLITQRR